MDFAVPSYHVLPAMGRMVGQHKNHRRNLAGRFIAAAIIAALGALPAMMATPNHAHAQDSFSITDTAAPGPDWPQTSFSVYARNEPIRDILQSFAAAYGIHLVTGRNVSGVANGRLFAPTPQQFLDDLAQTNGLVWFYYGGTLYVNPRSEITRSRIDLPRGAARNARTALEELGLIFPQFGVTAFPENDTVIVSGPPPYVSLVREVLGMLPQDAESAETAIYVYRLKHASAEDRTFYYRDKEVTIPGVTSILRNLMQTGNAGAAIQVQDTSSRSESEQPLDGLQGAGLNGQDRAVIADNRNRNGNGNDGNEGPAGPSQMRIQSDPRLNAVIIRDTQERIDQYKSLLETIDIPVALIEIEAAVVDVNVSKLEELGVDWRAQDGNVSGGFGNIETAAPGENELSVAVGPDANLNTILTSAGSYFLTKIRALESKGDARISSRPSVLTVDNLEAVLDLSRTIYVRVSGERVANLFPVTAGIMLRVTPRLVSQSNQHSVQLDVDIEDGTIDDQTTVDEIPSVQRSTISTQAVVGRDQSLLIGGYVYETEVDNESKVPFLGDIPGLGVLFRSTEKSNERRERFFMITPKIVNLPAAS
ncbi:type III secretion system outer membrane ring subunit SctC [Thalassospira sp. MA62]|nr:type III secretion system outer membrane ring subunit SctC [Thalassospira sp. MA62]